LPSESIGFSLTLPTPRGLPGEKGGAAGFPEDHAESGHPPMAALLMKSFRDHRLKSNQTTMSF
jgi:hypothetical protein